MPVFAFLMHVIFYLLGSSLDEIEELYNKLKDKVFKGTRPYDSSKLETHLKDFFEDKTMDHLEHPKYAFNIIIILLLIIVIIIIVMIIIIIIIIIIIVIIIIVINNNYL